MTPAVIAPGGKYNLTWGGGDPDLPVALTLRQGDYRNLDVVSVIDGSVEGTSYLWTVPSNLPDRPDYALQISQGIDDSNFSGKIALVNSTASSTSSSSSSATSSSSSSGATGGGAAVAPIQSAITSNTTTTTMVAASNATTTTAAMMMGTGAVGTGASGTAATGTAMMRNTTMSMATLSSTASSTAEATSTTAEETGTSTGSGAGASPSSGAVERAGFRSSELALVLGAVVAVACLG
ncbi:MAG: hypothetical protein Q9222_001990 [Ikaeria aurantiellina]